MLVRAPEKLTTIFHWFDHMILQAKANRWLINLLLVVLLGCVTAANLVKNMIMPVYRAFFAARQPVLVRTPDERFVSAGLENLGYNFPSHYVDLPVGRGSEKPRMHFIDEFAGSDHRSAHETVLCLHGEPTWSFSYRKIIPTLVSAGYRVIAPDFIGFGKSDKYVDASTYNHEFHMWSIRYLMDELKLDKNVTLFCHDWGGLVGLSLVKDTPDVFSNLVIMNTGLPVGFEQSEMKGNLLAFANKALPFLLWRSAVSLFGTYLPLGILFKYIAGFPDDITAAYTAPFPSHVYKGGVAKWPLLVPIFKDDPVAQHMVEARNCLRLWTKPALLLFGDQDLITRGQEEMFQKLMPHAKSIIIKGASHFLQESHSEQLGSNVVQFLSKH